MPAPRPMKIPLDSVPFVPGDRAVTRVRIARLVTRERCGSELLLGACWMDPGDETNTWSSRATDDVAEGDHWYGPVHETYFIVRGHLRIWWDDGEADLRADDAFYLAPGHTYRLVNVGDEPAFFVYGMVPTPE